MVFTRATPATHLNAQTAGGTIAAASAAAEVELESAVAALALAEVAGSEVAAAAA